MVIRPARRILINFGPFFFPLFHFLYFPSPSPLFFFFFGFIASSSAYSNSLFWLGKLITFFFFFFFFFPFIFLAFLFLLLLSGRWCWGKQNNRKVKQQGRQWLCGRHLINLNKWPFLLQFFFFSLFFFFFFFIIFCSLFFVLFCVSFVSFLVSCFLVWSRYIGHCF